MRVKKFSINCGGLDGDEIVTLINTELITSEMPNYVIGRLLFEIFFHGNPEEVTNRDPKKRDSFRKIAGRKDLNATYDWLYKTVRVVMQDDFFQRRAIDVSGVAYSHKVELLSLPDGDEKIQLVQKLIYHPLSVRDLRKEVKQLKDGEPKNKLPELSKSLRNIATYLKNVNQWIDNNATKFQSLDSPEKESLKEMAIEVRAHISDIDGKYSVLINALERERTSDPSAM